MSDVTFTAGDTSPSLFGTLSDSNGALDLTQASSVRFQMRLATDARYVVDSVATIVTPAAGAVRYDWDTGDLSVPGEYVSRWYITWSDLTTQHSEPENTITVDPA